MRSLIMVACIAASSLAAAQEPSLPAGAPGNGGGQPLALSLPWTAPSGQGVALSYENGSFGQVWEQGLKLQVGFGPCGPGRRDTCWAVNLKPQLLMELQDPSAIALGGRLELIGRTPVYLNLIRIYGGGGIGTYVDLSGPHKGQVSVGGGGEFGFEFFLARDLAFYAEIGGNGCPALGNLCSGATVVAGVSLYL